ncbi:MAG: ChaN family lipoprotein [Bacteroidetes bacterium]|nr:ChaN family lipoprotein [Bacteroidota bacterium]
MKKSFIIICILLTGVFASTFGSGKPAYKVFTSKGRSAGYQDIVKAARTSDFVLFGELHDNPICHWLELQLAKDLLNVQGKRLVLGAEMFETDNQLLLNEYVTRQIIRKKDFDAEAKLWSNYKTDYSPLVEFARENRIRFVATSVPRRFAAVVNIKGFEGLDNIMANERGLIAPLPIPYDSSLNCYKNITQAAQGMAHMGDNLARAQALKDATMAWFMLKNALVDSTIFLHFNGSYHSENHEGIFWMAQQYLKRGSSTPVMITVTCVEQEDLSELQKSNEGKADFIIVIPSDMTKTYASDPMFAAPAKPSADNKKDQEAKPKPDQKEVVADDDDDE